MKISHKADKKQLLPQNMPSIEDQLAAIWETIETLKTPLPDKALQVLNQIRSIREKYNR